MTIKKKYQNKLIFKILTFWVSPSPYCPIAWNLFPADTSRLPNATCSEKAIIIKDEVKLIKHLNNKWLSIHALTLSVKNLSMDCSCIARLFEVEVSAFSHALERFRRNSPNSSPHWSLNKNQDYAIFGRFNNFQHTQYE